jgi:phosphatidyl-myo-inositol dimannoside synthase
VNQLLEWTTSLDSVESAPELRESMGIAARPMHALLLTDMFLPHGGGSRTYYYHLHRSCAPDKVTVLTRKTPGWQEFDSAASDDHFKVVRRFRPRDWKRLELSRGGLFLLQAASLVRRREVDVIHSGDLFPQGLISVALKRWFSMPFIAFTHGEDFTLTDRFPNQSRLRDRIYRAADAVIANAEYSRGRLVGIGVPADRIHKITPGVDATRFHPAVPSPRLQARYDLSSKFVLLTVARLIQRKGHDTVLRALAKLAPEFPNLRYLIVGTGPAEGHLKDLAAQLNVSHLTHFVGFVPDAELPEYYRLCDLMVMPNREELGDLEGFGITFLEASATGKPVIGGRSGGVEEAVNEGVSGELVNGTDVDELTAKIRSFIVNPRKGELMGAAGRRRAEMEFDWKPRAERLHMISRAVVKNSLPREYVGSQELA